MNHLAHLLLAGDSPGQLVGNLAADFVKGRLNDCFCEDVTRGIRLHRKIDAFTDGHGQTLVSRNRFSAVRRRFAGVIVDLIYDHFLCKHWDLYSDTALPDFIAHVYDLLERSKHLGPEALRAVLPRLVSNDWLAACENLSGVEGTLDRLSRRLRYANTLDGSMVEIRANYVGLERDFLRFFPEAIRYAAICRQALGQDTERLSEKGDGSENVPK